MERLMNVSFDHYRIFCYVARYGNVTLAADALLCNQPNVTRTIKNLEGELGCTLFVRSNRGVRLTPEGERLYARVRIAVEQIELAEAELAEARTLRGGAVTVGATEVALHTFLLPVLKEYRQAYPGIRLRISNYTATQAIAALKNSLVDIAVITALAGEKVDGLRARELRTVGEAAVCGRYFSDLCGREVTLRELARYPLVALGKDTKTYEMYSRWFSRHGVAYSPVIEAATAGQILPMVRSGLGVGFVPEDFLDAGMGGEVCRVALAEPLPQRSVILLKRPDGVLSMAAKALEQQILAESRRDFA